MKLERIRSFQVITTLQEQNEQIQYDVVDDLYDFHA